MLICTVYKRLRTIYSLSKSYFFCYEIVKNANSGFFIIFGIVAIIVIMFNEYQRQIRTIENENMF